ncbi:uncharacterized protein DS421_8g229840 [Arachis hypogaea]|nr:uncharacterized protein DS421_8g229840 [Arachis hypogaea]
MMAGHDSPASRNICSVSRVWPFSRIMVLMICAGVEVASKACSTPFTKVTVICGGCSSVRRFTSTWHAGFDSLALRELHCAMNSIHEHVGLRGGAEEEPDEARLRCRGGTGVARLVRDLEAGGSAENVGLRGGAEEERHAA